MKPPYAKRMTDPQPIVHIHAGEGSWERAKADQEIQSLVWDGQDYEWPVSGCICMVEIGDGMEKQDCMAFAAQLLRHHAKCVLLWWTNRDDGMPIAMWGTGERAELTLEDLREVFQ